MSRNLKASIFIEPKGLLQIGNNVGMSSPAIWVKEKVSIGDNVLIGADCFIMDNDAHSLNYQFRNGEIRNYKGDKIDHLNCLSAPITIEKDVWIGMRCIILKGVTIGARSIIGAGSIVTKSIPQDSLAVGNPCKVIRKI